MSVEPTTSNELVKSVAGVVVAEMSPADVAHFGALAEDYFGDRLGALRSIKAADEPLGFGIEVVGVALVQVVLYLADKAVDAAFPHLTENLWRRLFRSKQTSVEPLTAGQIDATEAAARSAAKQIELSPDLTDKIIPLIVARLAAIGRP
ncbi:hypothetical protein [Catellatospora citrea]|uniref:Uncharacterized protein n=1 Tax=Catellatospora citrea TaxID=53366 RepID=A0A8J3K923_9ACTN|nr:hypothetical protein [Catellatospora citrea]RKE12136.1 hypothetical protein C8E86_7073 [Catellatospora citrea]GIF98901.1 hypothetical protein Cci01nite_39950 [Catellatospora citrea]